MRVMSHQAALTCLVTWLKSDSGYRFLDLGGDRYIPADFLSVLNWEKVREVGSMDSYTRTYSIDHNGLAHLFSVIENIEGTVVKFKYEGCVSSAQEDIAQIAKLEHLKHEAKSSPKPEGFGDWS